MLYNLFFCIICGILAGRTDTPPVIDGSLADRCWSSAEVVESGFNAFRPVCDVPLSQPTSIRILYDETALYFGCFMHDPDPSRINHQTGARDEDAPVDKIYIYLDTFNDDANCFVFVVTVDGTQLDSRRTEIGGDDLNWDAVWTSAVTVCDSGWTAEAAIPFSALRYSDSDEQVWGVNFGRTISYANEAGYLFRMREQGGTDVSLFGDIDGLCMLPSGHGIEIRPFAAGRLQFNSSESLFDDPWGSAGADLKIPLSMQTVIDISVFPDFGQVESDADQGNISHWAPWLNEKRPFFMEGTEVFDMPFDMFYSRRIGSVASNDELIQILGGVKLTGTGRGIRYGVLEVVTERVWSGDTTLIEPAASFFAGSVLQEYSRGNWFKFSGTTVDVPPQEGTEYDYGRSAAFSGMATPFENIKFQGKLGMTWNREEARSDNSAVRIDAGYFPERFELNFRYQRKGDDFNPDRLGYFQGNGEEVWSAYSSVSIDVNSGLVDDVWFDANPYYTVDTRGRNAGSGVTVSAGGVTNNRYDLNVWADYGDRWFDRYEGPGGRWYPGGFSGGITSSTDYRSALAGWVSFNWNHYLDSSISKIAGGLRIKPYSELFLCIEPSIRIQEPATRYNWDIEEWENTDSDWKSLNLSATLFLSRWMRIRLNGQVSRFERNWDTQESSSVTENIWANILYSWEYAPGSWFHFLAGEVQDGEEDPVFTLYAKLMRYF